MSLEAKQIDLLDYLAALGHRPQKSVIKTIGIYRH